MQVYESLENIPVIENPIITIGSFDGVHKGHQKLIQKINQLAKEVDGESVIITFDPHPRKIIYPNGDSLNLLNSKAEKLSLFKKFKVDHVVLVPFTVEFSQISADEYIETFLVKRFKPKYIVIGYDHRFGLNRIGNINFLKAYEEKFGYKVIEIEKQEIEDITISSTKVRDAIAQKEIAKANNFLNYNYLLSGNVIHGEKIGTKIGYSTANIQLDEKDKLIPGNGIYAVRVWVDELQFDGMLYIGKKPTLHDDAEQTIEVHIFDFNENLYGQYIRLELIAFMRADEKFSDINELRDALQKDEVHAKAVLAKFKKKSQLK